MAQTTPTTAAPVKEANQADVASLDAIMKAVYDVISGDAGQKRDWDRFRSLFHKDAKLIPSGKNAQTGVQGARFLTPEEYITRSGPMLEQNGFHERELELTRAFKVHRVHGHTALVVEQLRHLRMKRAG